MAEADMRLLEIADELYGLPLAEFTPARDARVKELKAGPSKDTDLAAAVKALRKPSVAAWVVDLLVRRETEQVEQVLTVGEALRDAQAGMDAAELRTLTKQRRQLTAAVTTRARATAKDAGLKVTPAVADQVEATLTAAMIDADCARAVRSGLLVTALAATGVGETDLSEAVAVPEALGFTATPREADAAPAEEPARRPDLRVVPDPDAQEKKRKAARAALDEARSTLRDAERARDKAARAVGKLEAKSMQLQAQADELRAKLAEVEASAEELDEQIEEAEDARSEAEDEAGQAEAARDEAQEALDALD